MAAFADRLRLDGSLVRQLQLAGLAAFGVAFAVLTAYGHPGTGFGQGFYVAIVLVALATGPVGGALAGVASATLYVSALALRDTATWSDFTSTRVLVHGVAYVSIGVLVGFVASRARDVFADSLRVIDSLMTISRRDLETGALEPDEFDRVLATRARRPGSIGLVVVLLEPEAGASPEEPDGELVRRAHGTLLELVDGSDLVGRTGPRQLAAVVPLSSASASGAAALEHTFDALGCRATVAWASSPEDGADALSLYGSALERLQARRLLRGDWTPAPGCAGLAEAPAADPRPL